MSDVLDIGYLEWAPGSVTMQEPNEPGRRISNLTSWRNQHYADGTVTLFLSLVLTQALGLKEQSAVWNASGLVSAHGGDLEPIGATELDLPKELQSGMCALAGHLATLPKTAGKSTPVTVQYVGSLITGTEVGEEILIAISGNLTDSFGRPTKFVCDLASVLSDSIRSYRRSHENSTSHINA